MLKSGFIQATKVIQFTHEKKNQSQEQVAQGVKDREIIAIKSLTKSIKTNPKVKYLQNSYGDPLISHKSKGVVGVPTNGDMLGEPVISVHQTFE